MNKYLATCACLCLSLAALAQHRGPPPPPENITPGDNLVIENIPPVPTRLAGQTERYSESRSAMLYGWHPSRHEMLIGTRFGDTVQIHSVTMATPRKELRLPVQCRGLVYPEILDRWNGNNESRAVDDPVAHIHGDAGPVEKPPLSIPLIDLLSSPQKLEWNAE